jgi:hypothetical protein
MEYGSDTTSESGWRPRVPSDPSEIGFIIGEYQGYNRKEDRHVSDEAMRAHLLVTLGDLLLQLESLEAYLQQNMPEEVSAPLRELVQNVEMNVDRLQAPPYSVSLFFTMDKVPQKTRRRVAEDDLNLVKVCSEIEKVLAPTLNDSSEFTVIVNDLTGLCNRVDHYVESRLSTILEYMG